MLYIYKLQFIVNYVILNKKNLIIIIKKNNIKRKTKSIFHSILTPYS